MIDKKASDLHLKEGRPPMMRIDGKLMPLDMEILSSNDMKEVIFALTDERTRKRFEELNEMDLAYNLEGVARFRANAFKQMGKLECVLRAIPIKIPTLEEISVPAVLREIALFPRGLVLVTGTTGSGKSTTLAAMINTINETYNHHIVTIEDPIEFVHTDKKSSITQREVGLDTDSFANALKYVLRQDPDVILIGEMRDSITVGTAISAAETGHMVFSTLHTMDTIQTINRILDFFPKEQQAQVRVQLAGALKAVISLRLVAKADGAGRVPAAEILVVTQTVKGYMEEGKLNAIRDLIKDGEQEGMQTFDQALIKLYKQGAITIDEARRNATSPQDIDLSMKGIASSRASAQSILDTMMKEQVQKELTGELKRARQLAQSGKHQEAHEIFEKMLQKYPDSKDASEGLAAAKAALYAEKHQTDIKIIINEGLNIYKKGNIRGAIVKWQEGLTLDPANGQLKAYIKSAEEKIVVAASTPAILTAGVEIYKTGNIDGAIEKWNEVLKIDINNAQAKSYIAGAQQKSREMKIKKESDALYKRGLAESDNGNNLEALMLIKQALEIKPDAQEIKASFDGIKGGLLSEKFGADMEAEIAAESFHNGIEKILAEDYMGALKELKKAAEKRPLDRKLKEYIEKAKALFKERLESLMAKVDENFREKNVVETMSAVNMILRIDPVNEFALKYQKELKQDVDEDVQKYYREATNLLADNQLKEARSKLENILKLDSGHLAAKKRMEEIDTRLLQAGGK
jgi:twitching motility protein PilT